MNAQRRSDVKLRTDNELFFQLAAREVIKAAGTRVLELEGLLEGMGVVIVVG